MVRNYMKDLGACKPAKSTPAHIDGYNDAMHMARSIMIDAEAEIESLRRKIKALRSHNEELIELSRRQEFTE